MNSRGLILMVMASLLMVSVSLADDWPYWRGPNHDGISTETDWNPQALNNKKIAWEAEVGIGFSSISVVNGKAYTMGNINKDTDVVFCFDAATGKEVWRHEYAEDLNPKWYDGGCSATPTVSEGKVYTISKTGKVFCLDAETGDVVWQKALPYEAPTWGFAGSALILGEKAFWNVGQSGIAMNKTTGEIIWKSDNVKPGYATPVPYEKDGATRLAIFGENTVKGVDAETGQVVWTFPWKTDNDVNAADPIVHEDKVFVTSGYNRGSGLFDISTDPPTKVWENKNMRSQMSGPVLIDGYLYGMDDNRLACLEWATGESKWTEKKSRKGALTAAGDKLIVISESGTLMIAAASPEGYQEIASAEILDGPRCWAPPVLANGRIYVRNSKGQLACVDVQQQEEEQASAD